MFERACWYCRLFLWEEQGKASNGGRYFAHLAGCVVAQTEKKYKLSFCLGYIYLNLACLKNLPGEIPDKFFVIDLRSALLQPGNRHL